MTADNVPMIKCHITLKCIGKPIIAQTRTMTNAAKPTIDCADLSDTHFAIVEKYSILRSVLLINHADGHQYLNHDALNHDALDDNPYRGHDASDRHDRNSLLIASLKP